MQPSFGTINSGLKCRVRFLHAALDQTRPDETRHSTKEKKEKERAGREEDGGGVGGQEYISL